ncbi:hypothetical protein [Enterobacter roggenkampii]|uniref:hypothetical protein n=1 Tax=Enterobacter roggenkampii TaxID=1812935 RepID=UPI001EF8F720|nr:hypothetical protein [Enterobacter roggenkampii]
MKITKQEVQAVSDLKAGYTLGNADVAIMNELARIALASLEAEAAYFINRVKHSDAYGDNIELRTYCYELDALKSKDDFGGEIVPVYTAPPAPVSVPDEVISAIENLKRTLVNCNRYNYCSDAVKRLEGACRAAMLQGADGNSPVIQDGYVLVPKKLTAENGAKGVLSGEFSETKYINCPECFGDDDCETCDGSGRIEITVPVTWTTIKAIWAKGVEHLAAAPQQEVK